MIGYPNEFLENMKHALGDQFPDFLRALSEAPVSALRLNPFKPVPFEGEAVPWEEMGRYVQTDFKPGKDLLHFAGAYYMQEASAMAPARVLSPNPGDAVLDLCAAPGGKAGQLAAMLDGQGVLVANEPSPRRVQALSGNLERLGVTNAVVTSATPEVLNKVWNGYFDKILIDAPCSGEGMMRREPTAREQWRPKQAEGCHRRQLAILRQAAGMLKPGGRLVYSTCTFNEVENEGTVSAFLKEHPDFAPVDFTLSGLPRSGDGCLKLWPHDVRGEGHFVALLKKRGRVKGTPRPLSATKSATDALFQFGSLARFDEALLNNAVPILMGDHLSLTPQICPPLEGVRVLRAGLMLGTARKGYMRPNHALAMALKSEEAVRTISLSKADAEAFIRGAELPFTGSGYTLVTYRGLPLGWGKQGTALKNHTPKGIRL